MVLVSAWMVLSALSIWVSWPGFINYETCSYLPHYLSGKPLLSLLYDARVTELGLYPGREFALFLDYVDCHFIAWSVKAGWPHYLSICHYACLLGAGWMLYDICRDHLRWGRLTSAAWSVLLWTGPSEMVFTSYFRNAKVGLLFAVLLAIRTWCRSRERGDALSSRHLAAFAATLFMMPMFDKQGLLYLLGGSLLMTMLWYQKRHRGDRLLMQTAWMVFALAYIYQGWIGHWIIWQLHHYRIVVEYASMKDAIRIFLADPLQGMRAVAGAVALTLDSFRFGLGDLPVGVAIALLAWAIHAHARPGSADAHLQATPVRWHLWLVLYIAGCFMLMQLLLSGVLSSEYRRFYYPMAFSGIWLPWLSLAVARWQQNAPGHALWVKAGLTCLIISNLAAIQEHRFVLRHGYGESWYAHARQWHDLLLARHRGEAMPMTPAEARARFEKFKLPVIDPEYPPPLEKDVLLLFFLSQEEHGSTQPHSS